MRSIALIFLLGVVLASPMQDCLDKNCPSQAKACKADPVGCLSPALKCDSKCGKDVACLRSCATASGNAHLKDLAACGESKCATLGFEEFYNSVIQDCLQKQCSSEYNACTKDIFGGCAGKALKCSNSCGDDAQCLLNCASQSGNSKLQAVAKCGEAHCLNNFETALYSPMQDCLEKKCASFAAACKSDPVGCLAPALKCDSKCGSNVSCMRTCAAASGNAHLKDLAACGEKNCANTFEAALEATLENPTQDCVEKKCASQVSACKSNAGCVVQAQKCSSKCGSNVSCLSTCAAGSGNSQLKALAACGEQNCANTFEAAIENGIQACLQSSCPSEYKSCTSDLFGCLPKATSCGNKCGEDAQCLLDCADASGNAKLRNLSTCGKAHCLNGTMLQACDIQNCIAKFQQACQDAQSFIQCGINFWLTDEECSNCGQ